MGQVVEDCSTPLITADHWVTSMNWLWFRQTAELNHKNICVNLVAIPFRVLTSSPYFVVKGEYM